MLKITKRFILVDYAVEEQVLMTVSKEFFVMNFLRRIISNHGLAEGLGDTHLSPKYPPEVGGITGGIKRRIELLEGQNS